MIDRHAPLNAFSLWWLGRGPAQPCLVGQLVLSDGNRKVGLEYAAEWIGRGFELSGDLPLRPGLFLPEARHLAAGAVDDARPDSWGERVIRCLYRPARVTALEYLYFAGDDRFGGMVVSSATRGDYQPCQGGAIDSAVPGIAELDEMACAAASVLADEDVSERAGQLLRPGCGFGGALPKSLIEMEGAQWLVKFPAGEDFDTELVEHATMCLAARCGIRVAETRALPLRHGKHALAVRRFDRMGDHRSHVISAKSLLRSMGSTLGYPELAQSLRRVGRAGSEADQRRELFRRMVFNILMDNTDDHEKNHAFVRAQDGFYDLSLAYDVVPSVQGLGQQQLRIGKLGAESSIENALSEANAFGLSEAVAVDVIKEIVASVEDWKEFFSSQGVVVRDIELMTQYIDGSALKAQRREFSKLG